MNGHMHGCLDAWVRNIIYSRKVWIPPHWDGYIFSIVTAWHLKKWKSVRIKKKITAPGVYGTETK